MTFQDQNICDKIKNSGRIIRNTYKNEFFLDVKHYFLTDVFVSFFNVPKMNFWGFFL